MGTKVLVASPIHQKPEILKHFLHSLVELEGDLDFYFIDDNIDRRSKEILGQFKMVMHTRAEVLIRPSQLYDSYIKTEVNHQWTDKLIWKVASFKDEMINYAKANNYDYLFLVDSDLLLNPKTINQLISVEKDIVSEIFWTKWSENAIEEPQVWQKDQYTQYQSADRGSDWSEVVQFYHTLRQPGLYKIGGLGACTLISKKAMDAGVKFEKLYNLSFWGEDRHFCVRAVALGFELFVETTYPAYHIYRDSDLQGVDAFKQANHYTSENPILGSKGAKLTLSMIVKNEADRYLRQILTHAKQYIDEAVIIDDHSTDETKEIIKEVLEGIPYTLIENSESKFHNEIDLRKQQWQEVIKTNPDWILNLDADEQFEDGFIKGCRALINEENVYLYSFRLYDFWNDSQYREDTYWSAHKYYRPFLLKYVDNFDYEWREQSQHCGRFPYNVFQLPNKLSDYRLKHFGWALEAVRKHKYERYQTLDPEGKYGILAQYMSILDANPNLIDWVE